MLNSVVSAVDLYGTLSVLNFICGLLCAMACAQEPKREF